MSKFLKSSSQLTVLNGIGQKTYELFKSKDIITILDLLLYLPIRYEDRSKIVSIQQSPKEQTITLKAKVKSVSNKYTRGKLLTFATIVDETANLKCMWFNNKYIKKSLKKGHLYFFSGKINQRNTLIQATYEPIKKNQLHTGRLVPIYSSKLGLSQHKLRKYIKQCLDYTQIPDLLKKSIDHNLLELHTALKELHFPSAIDKVTLARERLALEEMIDLINYSHQIKKDWQQNNQSQAIQVQLLIPQTIPFTLTNAQQKALKEIIQDMSHNYAMNRLLLGDVGSGKTVVALIAAYQTIQNNCSACLIAPTKILAKQHYETAKKILPNIEKQLLTSNKDKKIKKQPCLYIGTHSVINKLADIKPTLIIYDEQHRFGVKQRSEFIKLKQKPHVLTMTATPIPRSLMLTIFSHLEVSIIDQMPSGKKIIHTQLITNDKKKQTINWVINTITKNKQDQRQAIVICPFIDPSDHDNLKNVSAASEVYKKLSRFLQINHSNKKNIKIDLLHGRLSKSDQKKIIQDLYSQKTQILVTTPMVEVGVDLPKADIIMILSAQRFGLASLHQLRGRVGRKGQESYCLLFSASKSRDTQQRLKKFTKINNGLKLAELDLHNRGAGDIFGVNQHGLETLKYGSWTNLNIIKKAQSYFQELEANQINWQSQIIKHQDVRKIPAAN